MPKSQSVMADANVVCSMCGDVGFADKLFRCTRCHFRFQHSYCTNYYEEAELAAASATAGLCDWCISEERRGAHLPQIKLTAAMSNGDYSQTRSPSSSALYYATAATAGRGQDIGRGRGKSGAISPKPAGRRYKLLKDVLC